jgi:hypothetical protein
MRRVLDHMYINRRTNAPLPGFSITVSYASGASAGTI